MLDCSGQALIRRRNTHTHMCTHTQYMLDCMLWVGTNQTQEHMHVQTHAHTSLWDPDSRQLNTTYTNMRPSQPAKLVGIMLIQG